MKTSKTIFRRKALAFLGAAAVMLSAVFMASCKPNVGGSSGGGVTYKAGDIVLSDKSVVEKDAYKAIDTTNPPVGVVCCYTGNSPRMIALHSSDSNLRWARDGSTGYNTKFEGIICTQTGSGAALTATFTGDTDGSDNWVSQYNTKYADKLNNKNFDWYMPSIAELCEVYKNRTAIDASLAKIHGLTNGSGYADEKLVNSYCWSSSQSSASNNAWLVDFSGGYVVNYKKNSTSRVCCLAGF